MLRRTFMGHLAAAAALATCAQTVPAFAETRRPALDARPAPEPPAAGPPSLDMFVGFDRAVRRMTDGRCSGELYQETTRFVGVIIDHRRRRAHRFFVSTQGVAVSPEAKLQQVVRQIKYQALRTIEHLDDPIGLLD